MTSPKEKALELLKSMPDTVGWDDIIHEFYVWIKIEESLKQMAAEEVVLHEEVDSITLPERN